MDFSINNPPRAVRKVETLLIVEHFDGVRLDGYNNPKRLTLPIEGVRACHLALWYRGEQGIHDILVSFEDNKGQTLGTSLTLTFETYKEEQLLILPTDTRVIVLDLIGIAGGTSPYVNSTFYGL